MHEKTTHAQTVPFSPSVCLLCLLNQRMIRIPAELMPFGTCSFAELMPVGMVLSQRAYAILLPDHGQPTGRLPAAAVAEIAAGSKSCCRESACIAHHPLLQVQDGGRRRRTSCRTGHSQGTRRSAAGSATSRLPMSLAGCSLTQHCLQPRARINTSRIRTLTRSTAVLSGAACYSSQLHT